MFAPSPDEPAAEAAVEAAGGPRSEAAEGSGRALENGAFALPAEGVSLDAVEKSLVEQALQRAGGNRTRAGELLGLTRDQIRYRIVKFGLDRGDPPR